MLRKLLRIPASALLFLSVLFSVGCGDSASGGTLTGIDIAPISPSIAVGGTQQFTATGHFSNGPDQNITAQSNWSSSNTSIATIQQFGTVSGLAKGVAAGQSTITASFAQGSSSVQGSTSLTVTNTVAAPLNQGDGTILLLGTGSVQIDGRSVDVSGSMSLTLSAGAHTLRNATLRHTLAIVVGGGEAVSIEIPDMKVMRE
jgi:Bacterial Ig-like domain (group 2)